MSRIFPLIAKVRRISDDFFRFVDIWTIFQNAWYHDFEVVKTCTGNTRSFRIIDLVFQEKPYFFSAAAAKIDDFDKKYEEGAKVKSRFIGYNQQAQRLL